MFIWNEDDQISFHIEDSMLKEYDVGFFTWTNKKYSKIWVK